jgi:hypothetical protein
MEYIPSIVPPDYALLNYIDNMHANGTDADYNHVLATSLNYQSPIRTVLSDEGETQLKKRKFTEKDECDSCPIFHIPFDIDEEVTELPCGHIFSPDGIEKWLKEEKSECPLCRFKLASKEITLDSPQWTENINELSASRAALATNLITLEFPLISEHPFGQASHRIVHEDDDMGDIIRALSMTFNDSYAINPIINYHASDWNDNVDHLVTTTPMTYIAGD